MDLNKIELPAFLIVDLYKDMLVSSPAYKEVKTEDIQKAEKNKLVIPDKQNPETFKFLGNNKKNILVVVNNNDAVFLPDNQLTFLTGILNACKLSLDDIALFNFSNYPEASYKEILPFFNSKVMLLFAVAPEKIGLPVSFPEFQIQPFSTTTLLYSASLSDLEHDKELKGKLWMSLKRLFNLSN